MEAGPSSTDELGTQPQGNTAAGGWIFPLLLAGVLVILLLFALSARRQFNGPVETLPAESWTPSEPAVGETVGLEIDFGNGVKKQFLALPWQKGMTVADLLAAAQDSRPGIRFSQQGTGASGFLTSLEGLSNEGAGGRNWIYSVDGSVGRASFCLAVLQPGSQVLWHFTADEYN